MDGIPASVVENLVEFHDKISKLEEAYKPILSQNTQSEHPDPLERAKSDLLSLYALNSTFWSLMCTKGLEPKETFLMHELERVKKFMEKIHEIEDRSKAPKLDKRIVQSFVRNALFDHTSSEAYEKKDKINDDQDQPQRKKLKNEEKKKVKKLKKKTAPS